MMFYIRTDANKEIAVGHVMRCLSIAEALKKKEVDTCFLVADHSADKLIESRGFATYCLESKWNNMEAELTKLKEIIFKNKIETLLVDSYYVSHRYFKELGKWTKIIYMDDILLASDSVHTVINYNIGSERIDYHTLTGNPDIHVLQGTSYAPLRSEFQNANRPFRNEVADVLITTGGTDQYNVAGNLIEAVSGQEDFSRITFHVICGLMNVNKRKLVRQAKNVDNIRVYEDVKYMSPIMSKCDIAISASGSTIYELCAMGIPIITFSLADNQREGAGILEEKRIALSCGDCRDGLTELVVKIISKLRLLMSNRCLRQRMHCEEQSIVDGRGATRIADYICNV